MIYGLLDGGSSQLHRLPSLAAVCGRSHLLTLQVDGINPVSNSGRRQHCKEHCRDTRPGRKPLEVCQSKVLVREMRRSKRLARIRKQTPSVKYEATQRLESDFKVRYRRLVARPWAKISYTEPR